MRPSEGKRPFAAPTGCHRPTSRSHSRKPVTAPRPSRSPRSRTTSWTRWSLGCSANDRGGPRGSRRALGVGDTHPRSPGRGSCVTLRPAEGWFGYPRPQRSRLTTVHPVRLRLVLGPGSQDLAAATARAPVPAAARRSPDAGASSPASSRFALARLRRSGAQDATAAGGDGPVFRRERCGFVSTLLKGSQQPSAAGSTV